MMNFVSCTHIDGGSSNNTKVAHLNPVTKPMTIQRGEGGSFQTQNVGCKYCMLNNMWQEFKPGLAMSPPLMRICDVAIAVLENINTAFKENNPPFSPWRQPMRCSKASCKFDI